MKKLIFYIPMLLLAACKERYDAPVQSPVTGYLVIEGSVNSDAGTTQIVLSRSGSLRNSQPIYETGATVKLEADDNSVYPFSEKGQGQYSADNPALATNKKYRLRIQTKSGKQYLSDFTPINSNPPIDTISWKKENGDGLQLYIQTHDPLNNTRYYQWSFDESWQIYMPYISVLKYKITGNGSTQHYSVVYKDSTTFSYDPTIIICWQFYSSQNLLLGSTAKLSSDIVYLPIEFIPHASVKLSVMYSINVKQYSWTKQGYEFLERMKKNTESTGSVFDPQPSELKGNFHCVTDPTEPVIGYFNICPAREKRIFIKSSDVVPWGYNSGCDEIEVENISDSILTKAIGRVPTTIGKTFNGSIVTFFAAQPYCVDCTLSGSNKKPAYWP
jgi:hypothetical protein